MRRKFDGVGHQVPDNLFQPRRIARDRVGFGRQFNEDLNNGVVPGETAPGLPAYAVLEFSALRSLGRNVDLFVGVQNALDQQYIVQLLPTTTGSPRLVHGGIRVRWSCGPCCPLRGGLLPLGLVRGAIRLCAFAWIS